jgi:hypothetical protein
MSHLVAIITEEQRNELKGQMWERDSYFEPIEDCNDNWIISIEEIEGNINPNFPWLSTLPLIDFCRKPFPSPGQ